MNQPTLKVIENEIAKIELAGFGEVTVKIKNGHIWRIVTTCDTLVIKEHGEVTCQQ